MPQKQAAVMTFQMLRARKFSRQGSGNSNSNANREDETERIEDSSKNHSSRSSQKQTLAHHNDNKPPLTSPGSRQESDGSVSRVAMRHSTMNPCTMPSTRDSGRTESQARLPMHDTAEPHPRQYSNLNSTINVNQSSNYHDDHNHTSVSTRNNRQQNQSTRNPIVVEAPLESLPWQMIGMGIMLDADDRDPPLNLTMNNGPQTGYSDDNRYDFHEHQYDSHATDNRCLNSAPSGSGNHSSSYNTNISPVLMIQVQPGIKKPLRGSDETWKAIEDGRVTITCCVSCQIDLNCVEDAELVVCPDCTMISPVDQTTDAGSNRNHRYGVGVGIKPEAIRDWIRKSMQ